MNKDAEVGWLAGIMDGEGSICLNLGSERDRAHMHFCAVFSNTSIVLIEKVERILNNLGVSFKTYHAAKPEKAWKMIHQVKVMRIDAIKRLLPILDPHLTAKLEVSRLMQEFLKERSSAKRVAFSERCTELAAAIRALNKRGSVETAPEPQETVKIQSELPGDRKNAAEMPASKVN